MSCSFVVSIINYRTGALTLQCIRSVLEAAAGHEVHVVVVDNASGDGSAETIADWIAAQPAPLPVTLVKSPRNTGFSGGHNIGMRTRTADAYLILNSDALLRPGFFDRIAAALAAHPEAGLFAPRIEHEDGTIQTSCFRFPSPLGELVGSARKGPVTWLFKRHEVALGPHPDPAAIEWASFACILLRGRMVDELGPMDEGYFLYYEDTEYCLRARRAGWGIVHVPDARAVHFRGGSGPVKALVSARKRLPGYYYASRTRFFYQAHGWGGVILANLMWYLGRGVAHGARLLGKPGSPLPERQGRDIWINALRPLGPRLAPGE
ncbi:hypothetical protein SAMN05878503_1217 [Cereibacter ovatus]|uniref:Glycosyltransferase 2-like domain-containing protein n=1 Tax=Cereibacter ovatus TaxID=439529 RepID=A0A285D375_9RHOB|nr:glycosyltransferase family 2 protein [Cereibacter ovatus]SNX74267.1 hypothetical protein SAMN05878503_1217 [Cereibacter ovatus]